MKKVQVVFDNQKIETEKRYSLPKMEKALDKVFVERYNLVKGSNGFYLETGTKDDYVDFWSAILFLKDQQWFMDNIKTWLWFNSDDSSDPEDYAVEDIKSHYTANTPLST